MSLHSPTEHEKDDHPSTPTPLFDGGFAHQQPPSCRHGLPASRPAGCVRIHPCQSGFRQSMPERRARIVMFTQLTQI